MPLPPFTMGYLAAEQAAAALDDERVMAVIDFGPASRTHPADARRFTVGLPELGDGTVEVWRSRAAARTGMTDTIGWAGNEEALLGHLLVDESAFVDLADAAAAAYRRILAFSRRRGYPFLLRTWNYFPAINDPAQGLERYQAFCQGRHRALAAATAGWESRLPAASALGTRAPGLLIYFLAAREPGVQVENPRQVSAFRYPRRYGPKSPAFSRAILKSWGAIGGSHLYLSGAASIVGHATRHPADLDAQLRETLRNLETLLEEADRRAGAPRRLSLLKAYVRPPLGAAGLRERIAERFGADLPLLVLQADICRRDLLVEIEGVAVSGA